MIYLGNVAKKEKVKAKTFLLSYVNKTVESRRVASLKEPGVLFCFCLQESFYLTWEKKVIMEDEQNKISPAEYFNLKHHTL